MANEVNYTLREIEPGDRFAGFSMGDGIFQPLKTFLTRDAKEFGRQRLARTYVFVTDENAVVAYVSLVCGEIAAENDNEVELEAAQYRYDHYPAIKIARLAVRTNLRGSGLGKELVSFSLGLADEVSQSVGCRFVVVDAKQPSIEFYTRQGFRLLDTEENKERSEPIMFIDLHTT